MLLAARAVKGEDKDIRLDVNGDLQTGGFGKRMTGDELLAAPLKIANASADPVTAVVTTVAPRHNRLPPVARASPLPVPIIPWMARR